MTMMHEEPYIHSGERLAIVADYPGWIDNSEVNYTWDL
jgi:hypothetical protein